MTSVNATCPLKPNTSSSSCLRQLCPFRHTRNPNVEIDEISSDQTMSRSFIANWQFAPHLVAGLEGDWQWVRSSHSFCRQTEILSLACVDDELNNTGFATVSGRLNSVATARARLGWTVDQVMLYGTGGAAFADVKSSLGLTCLAGGCGRDSTTLAGSVNSSTVQTGWVAGAGIEWMVSRNWIVRAEYQHIDLGDVSARFSPACGGCTLSSSQNLRLDIGRAGLSYKF